MHRSCKPVRKCHGCGLNFGEYCGVFENPREMWRKHTICPGYKNEKMLADYLAEQARKQLNPRKERRKAIAQMRRAVPHQDGDRHVLIAAVKQ